jgi:ABC-type multidrug transport system fused ATPase/permease subunit
LARALYADCDILLLDDPISAVDSKVAKKIFYDCLKKLSKNKTVILVTHQISYLYDCDEVIILNSGSI